MIPITVLFILALLALGFLIASIVNPPRLPLWVAVMMLVIIELLRSLPLGR